jgi:hypothetical protein
MAYKNATSIEKYYQVSAENKKMYKEDEEVIIKKSGPNRILVVDYIPDICSRPNNTEKIIPKNSQM